MFRTMHKSSVRQDIINQERSAHDAHLALCSKGIDIQRAVGARPFLPSHEVQETGARSDRRPGVPVWSGQVRGIVYSASGRESWAGVAQSTIGKGGQMGTRQDRGQLRHLSATVRAQLWLLPAVMIGAAIALAQLAILNDGDGIGWVFSGDPRTARDLLSTLLASMMTMTSLVVSMTFVILTLASNQLGSRLVASFMADRAIQALLGLFLATILFLLTVLRNLNDAHEAASVPHLAVTLGAALTTVCLLALLLYLHKLGRAIISDTVIERVGAQLEADFRAILPARGAGAARPARASDLPAVGSVPLGRSGYVQTIDWTALVDVAADIGGCLTVTVKVGDLVLPQGEHVVIYAPEASRDEIDAAIRGAFIVGPERSPAQDPTYSVRHLVEIALRALSPGINDAYTAIAVIDRLARAIQVALNRDDPPTHWQDDQGTVRVTGRAVTVAELIDTAFKWIHEAARNQPAVLDRLADAIVLLSPHSAPGPACQVLHRHLLALTEPGKSGARGDSAPGSSVARSAIMRARRRAFLRSH